MRSLALIGLALLVAGCGREEPGPDVMEPAPAPAPEPAEPMAPPPPEPVDVQLEPTKGNEASGTLTVAAEGEGVHITGTIEGLKPNSEHGIHIHEKGDCSAPDASSAGEHFAPLGNQHGAPGPNSHVGDLGNIKANEEGTAEVDVRAVQGTLRSGEQTDVMGKAIIVHTKADDLKSQPSGESGDRIACGVISE